MNSSSSKNSNKNGWFQSLDPATGRIFYANNFTRTTQWDPPPGWHDEAQHETSTRHIDEKCPAEFTAASLPDGWEEMEDPRTKRKFYIDHIHKVTTWEHPSMSRVANGSSKTSAVNANVNDFSDFGAAPSVLTLNRFGSHSKWDQNPRQGSRHAQKDASFDAPSNANAPPRLNFTVVSVPDALRPRCPSCHAVFSYTKRRHHCRLCGDVFCDACSSGRAVLPLDGEEFNVAVRVCDECMVDVKRGNYFSWRRYLTPLQLYDGRKKPVLNTTTDGAGSSGDKTKEITIDTVAASLSSLSVDIDAILSNPTNVDNQITIPAEVLIPAVGRHLGNRKTAEYAICVLASLVTLGNVVGNDSFALAVYGMDQSNNGMNVAAMNRVRSSNSILSISSEESRSDQRLMTKPCEIVDGILSVLEWSGSDGRAVGALEQAAKIIFYITEPTFIANALSMLSSETEEHDGDPSTNNSKPVDVDPLGLTTNTLGLDVHRAIRAMLDHATNSSSQSLQRWATASLRHLIAEDHRLACIVSSGPNRYESFTSKLVSTGGVTILCSLLGSDDADTRLHATSALEAIVVATREIGMTSSDAGGNEFYRVGRGTKADSEIIDVIVSNGGCGSVLAHLLMSADESVAMKGCEFSLALIRPLLTDPRGSSRSLHTCTSSASFGISPGALDDGLNSYRQAALALVIGEDLAKSSSKEFSCLPSLIQIMKSAADQPYPARSLKLQVAAAECLAAIALAVCHVVGAINSGVGSFDSLLYQRSKRALEVMENERIYELAYKVVTSPSLSSLDPSRNTPQATLREAVGLILFAMASCSNIAFTYLTSNRAVSEILRIAGESGMLKASSAVRGKWASRGLSFLEASTALMIRACALFAKKADDSSQMTLLSLLFDALDSGAISMVSRVMKEKVNLQKHDEAYSQIRIKIACCFMLSAMFEMASVDGTSRLYSAIDADCAASFASNDTLDSSVVTSTLSLLRATIPYAHKFPNDSSNEPLPMIELSEACLLAVGGMCGAKSCCFIDVSTGSDVAIKSCEESKLDKYTYMRHDACAMAFDALRMDADQGKLLPAVLIGTLGESCIIPMLRLSLAIAQNVEDVRGELVRTGILVPLCDILQTSIATLVQMCGPVVNAGNLDSGSKASLNNAIRNLSSVLSYGKHSNAQNSNVQYSLTLESLKTLEGLCANETLLNSISQVTLPAITKFLPSIACTSDYDAFLCVALNIVCCLASSPTHSTLVANSGIIPLIVKISGDILNNTKCGMGKSMEISLNILHYLASSRNDRLIKEVLLSNGVTSLTARVLDIPDISDEMSRIALMTVSMLVSHVFVSPYQEESIRLVHEISGKQAFLGRMIATMTTCEHEGILDNGLVTKNVNISIPGLYGKSFPKDVSSAAIRLLFQITWLFCADVKNRISFFNAFMLRNETEAAPTVAVACCSFLIILSDETIGFGCQLDVQERSFYVGARLTTVQKFLIQGLNLSLELCMSSETLRIYTEDLISLYKIPQRCLLFCQMEDIASEAFKLFQTVTKIGTVSVGKLLLGDKPSLMALLDLVMADHLQSANKVQASRTFALLLGSLAKEGFLTTAVVELGLRSRAIAALTAAIVIDGGDETIIDEDESSLSRICVNCLESILCNDQSQIEMTSTEARAMASAIGKAISSTVLGRIFTQASRESTLGDSYVDNSVDRANISRSPESRLLCAMSSFPESLIILSKVGGLEAVGLLAHDGDISAIRALKEVCNIDPNFITAVDGHISILDAMTSIENKLAFGKSNPTELREVAASCIHIITRLATNEETRSAIMTDERSAEALKFAAHLVVASSKHHVNSKARSHTRDAFVLNNEKMLIPNKTTLDPEEVPPTKLQLNDPVIVEPPSSKNDCSPSTHQLEGVIAHIGPVQFAPGDDWIGIRLTGKSSGLGKNNGVVKGVRYFDCDNEKDGVFVKKNNIIKKQLPDVTSETETEVEASLGDFEAFSNSSLERLFSRYLILEDDLSLERAALSLMATFLSSKPHRDILICNHWLMDAIIAAIRTESPVLIAFQSEALKFLRSSAIYTIDCARSVAELISKKVLQVSRDMNRLSSSKRMAALAISGLQALFSAPIGDDLRLKSIDACSGLFIYAVDSLYVGSKVQRDTLSVADGELFCNLTSLFLLVNGNTETRNTILSSRHVSSILRLILMTSGFDGIIGISKNEGAEYFDAAMEYSLLFLSFVMHEECQVLLEKSYALLIQEVEPSPGAFARCLDCISNGKFGGVSRLAARHLSSNIFFV
eukprot:CCRYP_011353-RA/>CCRYP_011353-RA protein AED:0.03 eAED:0.03 QI:203/0.6/0.66/1/0.8/0.66/6/0/2263